MLALIAIAVFFSTALITGSLVYLLFKKEDPLKERVAKLMPREEDRTELMSAPNKWHQFLGELGTKLQVKPSEMRKYREMTTAAGYRPQKVYVLLGVKLALGALLPALYLILYVLPQGKLGNGIALMWIPGSAIIGFLAPSLWMEQKAKARKEEIFHSLPDVLDLLTVCVEAGLSLDAALVRTIESFMRKNDPLIVEIEKTTLEMRAGRPRAEALKGLSERTCVDDIRSFVAMLVQTEKFGTSLGKTLRTYSDSLRTKRKQLAEESAAKTGIKMLFPLTFCVFPAILVVMLVPAAVKIFALFKSTH